MTNRLQHLLQLAENAPKESFILFALAKEYEGMGDEDHALKYYLKLKEADPGYVGLYYHLGKLYEQLEDTPKALDAYRQGVDVARTAGDMHALSELNGAKMNLEIE
jgi:tetratricopeptide (TPR) repeat protein